VSLPMLTTRASRRLSGLLRCPTSPVVATPSLHDALPISESLTRLARAVDEAGLDAVDVSLRRPDLDEVFLQLTDGPAPESRKLRSEEHTSELQSRFELVCRLLLEKKNTHSRL